jgi:hypothetical protein
MEGLALISADNIVGKEAPALLMDCKWEGIMPDLIFSVDKAEKLLKEQLKLKARRENERVEIEIVRVIEKYAKLIPQEIIFLAQQKINETIIIDELKELNLYSTEEDAVTHGDPSLIAEKLKHSKSVNEAYHAKVTSETKIQQEVNKSEAEIAKMKYDTINNIVKVVGAVVSFAVICATDIAKINNSKS